MYIYEKKEQNSNVCFYKWTFLHKIKLHYKISCWTIFLHELSRLMLKIFVHWPSNWKYLCFSWQGWGNCRSSLFHGGSTCIKHDNHPRANTQGTHRGGLAKCSLCSSYFSWILLIIKYCDYDSWIHLQNGHCHEILHWHQRLRHGTESLKAGVGQGTVSILGTVHVSVEMYKFLVPSPWGQVCQMFINTSLGCY